MINDFNDGAVGWTDWNVLLDEQRRAESRRELLLRTRARGHEDRRVDLHELVPLHRALLEVRPPGRETHRQLTEQQRAPVSTAFINPDGTVAVVVMNPTDKPVTYYLWIAGNAAEVEQPAAFDPDACLLACRRAMIRVGGCARGVTSFIEGRHECLQRRDSGALRSLDHALDGRGEVVERLVQGQLGCVQFANGRFIVAPFAPRREFVSSGRELCFEGVAGFPDFGPVRSPRPRRPLPADLAAPHRPHRDGR